MKNSNPFIGTDVSLEISLTEYNFIAQHTTKDYPDEYFVVYKQHDKYGTGYKRESELDSLIKGQEWADEENIAGFLSYTGCTKSEWLTSSFERKMSECLSYWGSDNIMGTDYYPISEEEAIERYINNPEK